MRRGHVAPPQRGNPQLRCEGDFSERYYEPIDRGGGWNGCWTHPHLLLARRGAYRGATGGNEQRRLAEKTGLSGNQDFLVLLPGCGTGEFGLVLLQGRKSFRIETQFAVETGF